MRRALGTGGCGFVGSAIVKRLLGRGVQEPARSLDLFEDSFTARDFGADAAQPTGKAA